MKLLFFLWLTIPLVNILLCIFYIVRLKIKHDPQSIYTYMNSYILYFRKGFNGLPNDYSVPLRKSYRFLFANVVIWMLGGICVGVYIRLTTGG